MKYMVGYQIQKSKDFMHAIVKYKNSISEVYFSWSDIANGRNTITNSRGFLPWEAQARQNEDLAFLSEEDIRLNLLLNGNCYGKYSQSNALFQKICQAMEYLSSTFNLQSVTTTSPLMAAFIKDNFSDIEVRASVNMDIGSTQGMDYVKEYFDSFYMQREWNRNRKQIQKLKAWCDKNGKQLYILANSGCLNHCSAHVFHDNLVAHENEIKEMDNVVEFKGICWDYLKDRSKWVSLLKDTNFIRPEEIHLYDPWFDVAKLATRVIANPVRVLESYINQKHSGSILDLCEPNHSSVLRPFLLENRKLPEDFIEKQLDCTKNCSECEYCSNALKNALVDLTSF